jgi:hypothetical protein
MNRLKHLKRTLPKNIEDNKNYDNCVFVVLNYNSQDNLHEWMLKEMAAEIKSGKVIYYRTLEPKFFWHNHAKNMAAKCTPKDAKIICSIDSDNFTAVSKHGIGLAQTLAEIFSSNSGKFFVRACGWEHRMKDYYTDHPDKLYSASGKIATYRKDFFKYRGFNEELKGHYFDEEELWKRLEEVVGFRKISLPVEFSKFINHTNYERLINLDPEIVDKVQLKEWRDNNHHFTAKEYMTQGDVQGYYPNGWENQEKTMKLLKAKVKIPNKKWGEGKVEKIR